ncbi:MAG: hypothetical protein CMJ46_02800 [Planctomyces sp.]|nr:hypothetical protein [Planctomyces sp.]
MFTFAVRLKQYQNDWYITVDGHRNAVHLRQKLQRKGLEGSRLQQLDGTSNYTFRIPQTSLATRVQLQKILRQHQQVRLLP